MYLQKLTEQKPYLVHLDLKLPDISGLQLFISSIHFKKSCPFQGVLQIISVQLKSNFFYFNIHHQFKYLLGLKNKMSNCIILFNTSPQILQTFKTFTI